MPFAKNKNAVSDAKMKEVEKAIRDFEKFVLDNKPKNKFTTDSKGNTTKNYKFGGKVVQKMQGGGSPLSPEEMEKAIREIKEQGTVFGKGKELSKDQTKKIADKFESDFNSIFGKKYGGAIKKMKYGGKVEKYGHGGSVKGGKMSCRGMGKANKGGGYSIR